MGQKGEEKIKPRQVAVAIPYYRSAEGQKEIEICLVTSRKHEDRYVLPKGGVEKGEEAFQSAVREMWEEAGLLPTKEWSTEQNKKPIGPIDDHKPHKHSNGDKFIPRAVYTAFLIPIKKGKEDCEKNEWPEKDERKRVWMKFDQACDAIEWRKDIFTLLKQSQSHLS